MNTTLFNTEKVFRSDNRRAMDWLRTQEAPYMKKIVENADRLRKEYYSALGIARYIYEQESPKAPDKYTSSPFTGDTPF
jgi:hypothetical protein